ncbi:putative neprosin [Medicago truncatula]|uniref:Putative neprosin n=1 Tax=Medicago truncatula TaxID=3880 RepID=A0A396GKV2_MEDTR|nr:putative neprosin [Medicago truncatula]
MGNFSDNHQVWSLYGESCPEESIPIGRTKEQDILRAGSISKFGRKLNQIKMDSNTIEHEHSIGYVTGNYKGAKADINVWVPNVEIEGEFSLAQIWILSDPFGDDRNTIEAAKSRVSFTILNYFSQSCVVFPQLYGDNRPRLFIYWTADGYKNTGCYNLLCPGFVQTNKNVVIGGTITPTSTYNGGQFEITLLIWKDQDNGNWWFGYGTEIVGYWPSSLFTQFNDNAHAIQFGGEIVNSKSKGSHTSTQMGSGHFAEENYGKAAYFKYLQVVKSDNSFHPLSEDPKYIANKPNCYNIKGGSSKDWGKYFFYGGPGRNENCP